MEYLHTNADGTTVKYTDEMIKNVINDLQYYKNTATEVRSRNLTIRQEVYDFFSERYDSGSDEITCSVEDVNELLDSIGADKLKRLYTVTGRIEFTITDIEADSEDDARDQVENNLSVEFDGNTVDDYSIDVNDVEQQ
jgi:flagellar basal body rod protein FlgB